MATIDRTPNNETRPAPASDYNPAAVKSEPEPTPARDSGTSRPFPPPRKESLIFMRELPDGPEPWEEVQPESFADVA